MKATYFFLSLTLWGFVFTDTFAQSPQGINYQGILRNNDGSLLPNQPVALTFTISGLDGTDDFVETVSTTSNAYGVISHVIGIGTPPSGGFADILWNTGHKYLTVGALVNGETIDLGTKRLYSVPYALFAEKVSSDWGGTHIESPDGETQVHTSLGDTLIYFKTKGEYHFAMNGPRLEFYNDQNSVFIGALAGASIQPDDVTNTFIGLQTGSESVGGSFNTAVGGNTFYYNQSGSDNTVIGVNTLANNTQGNRNIAVGNYAMIDNYQGNDNISIGYKALSYNEYGSGNIAIGKHAIRNNTAGNFNIAIGEGSMAAHGNSNTNIAIGRAALEHTSRSNTIAIGDSALNQNGKDLPLTGLSATSNTAIGSKSLQYNWTGWENTAVGFEALKYNIEGGQNVAIGAKSLTNNLNAWNNTAIGWNALHNNTEGASNVAIGAYALSKNTKGSYNIGIGEALVSNTTGHSNLGIGFGALIQNTIGEKNLALGSYAMNDNTSGNSNYAIGWFALQQNSTGDQNVGIGENVLLNNTNGTCNVGIGNWALFINSSGSFNTALGYGSGSSSPLDYGCTALGAESNYNITSDSLYNATAIGFSATGTTSNSVTIGNYEVTSIGGQVDWTSLSDGRFKHEILENVPGLDFIRKLRPVTYRWDVEKLRQFRTPPGKITTASPTSVSEIGEIRFTGFVAQEVEQAASETGFDFSGVDKPANEHDPYGLRYAEFTVPLVKAVQEQQQMIDELKTVTQSLLEQVATLRAENEQLRAKLDPGQKRP